MTLLTADQSVGGLVWNRFRFCSLEATIGISRNQKSSCYQRFGIRKGYDKNTHRIVRMVVIWWFLSMFFKISHESFSSPKSGHNPERMLPPIFDKTKKHLEFFEKNPSGMTALLGISRWLRQGIQNWKKRGQAMLGDRCWEISSPGKVEGMCRDYGCRCIVTIVEYECHCIINVIRLYFLYDPTKADKQICTCVYHCCFVHINPRLYATYLQCIHVKLHQYANITKIL